MVVWTLFGFWYSLFSTLLALTYNAIYRHKEVAVICKYVQELSLKLIEIVNNSNHPKVQSVLATIDTGKAKVSQYVTTVQDLANKYGVVKVMDILESKLKVVFQWLYSILTDHPTVNRLVSILEEPDVDIMTNPLESFVKSPERVQTPPVSVPRVEEVVKEPVPGLRRRKNADTNVTLNELSKMMKDMPPPPEHGREPTQEDLEQLSKMLGAVDQLTQMLDDLDPIEVPKH
jgi:hypothetical protein